MIKSLINKLFNLFDNKKQNSSKTITEHKYELPNSNSIVFWVGDDGLPYLKIYVVNTDSESAENFAEMLYSLNTGQYVNYTLSLLVEMSSQDLTVNTYLRKVIDCWYKFYPQDPKSQNEDEPYIKPTAFNSVINNEQ